MKVGYQVLSIQPTRKPALSLLRFTRHITAYTVLKPYYRPSRRKAFDHCFTGVSNSNTNNYRFALLKICRESSASSLSSLCFDNLIFQLLRFLIRSLRSYLIYCHAERYFTIHKIESVVQGRTYGTVYRLYAGFCGGKP